MALKDILVHIDPKADSSLNQSMWRVVQHLDFDSLQRRVLGGGQLFEV